MFYQLFTSGFLPALGALEDRQAVMATAGQGHTGGEGAPAEIRPLGFWSLPSWAPWPPSPTSHWPILTWASLGKAPWSCRLGRHGGSQDCEVK